MLDYVAIMQTGPVRWVKFNFGVRYRNRLALEGFLNSEAVRNA
jgi:hypothetical protein